MLYVRGTSKRFELDQTDLKNMIITAGLSALIVFVGSISETLPSLQEENGAVSLIITGVIGPALVTLKDWLTDYAERRR